MSQTNVMHITIAEQKLLFWRKNIFSCADKYARKARISNCRLTIFLFTNSGRIFRVAYRYITRANDSCPGRAKICLILTRGHERRKRVLASEWASEWTSERRRGRIEFKFTRILRVRKIRRKNRREISTYRQDAVDTGSHTEMPHTIFRYLLCESPIIWRKKRDSRGTHRNIPHRKNLAAPSNSPFR